MDKHVAVLMGGWSAEREVSLRSGKACAAALTRLGYRVTPIDVGRDVATVLTSLKPDVCLNILHGRPGEDGTLQGMLEVIGIPYTHSGVLASALAMQKDIATTVFCAADVPVAEGLVASRFEAGKKHLLPPPYVVKPIAEGSSKGVFVVTATKKAEFRAVETGLTGTTDIQIKNGLKENDEIITGSYKVLRTLKNGAGVKVDNSTAVKEES